MAKSKISAQLTQAARDARRLLRGLARVPGRAEPQVREIKEDLGRELDRELRTGTGGVG